MWWLAGFAREDNLPLYLNITTLLYELASTVAYGGNILINVRGRGLLASGRLFSLGCVFTTAC